MGTDPEPNEVLLLWPGAGGPLSSLRAEAAGLLQLLTILSENKQAPLLVFMDSLVLHDIVQKWGKANFNPLPSDIIHFDVIFLLLYQLRQWQHPVRLVKSHRLSHE